jgi:AraC-like DNA-binding protein
MKPFFQKLVPLPEQSIIFMDEEKPHFTVPWHFHPEIEILLVVKSSGTSYIGDNITRFTDGEICIIGENVPHWWKSDDSYLDNRNKEGVKALVIQFSKEIFNSNFINLPEMSAIRELLENSQRGIRFSGRSREVIGKQIIHIFQNTGIKRITELILLLDIMANASDYCYLSSVGYSKTINTFDFYRFNKIHEYIIRNFTKTIKLEEIASTVNMCETAFCRYFKKHTGKTFSSFINEFRIGHACKLLVEENITISRACFESGFNNLSHFNEQFKKITHHTPTEYMDAYKNKETVNQEELITPWESMNF